MRRSPAVVAITAANLVAVITVMTGCSTPPWQTEPAAEPTSAGASAATPSSTASGAATPTGGSASGSASSSASSSAATTGPTGPTNDLATGAARSTVTAGAITLTVNYWSTLDMGEWTPLAAKPLTMSLTAKLASGSTQDVYLTQVTVTPTVTAAGEAVAAPEPLVDTASVEPGYQIDKPNSYQQVFVLPAVDATATSLALTITYEMLLPTTPTSKTYSRQTASDSLTISLA